MQQPRGAGSFIDLEVELTMKFVPSFLVGLKLLGHFGTYVAKFLDHGLIDTGHSAVESLGFEQNPKRVHIENILEGHAGHSRSLVRDCVDQPFNLEPSQRLPNRSQTHSKRRRQLLGTKRRAWRITTVDDCLPQIPIDAVDAGPRPGNHGVLDRIRTQNRFLVDCG